MVAKSKPNEKFSAEDCRSVSNSTRFECVSQLVTLKAQSSKSDLTSTGRPVARGLNENTASSSQVWHSDANKITSMGRPVAETTKKTSGTKLSYQNFEISRNNVGHLQKVHSNIRRKPSRPQGDDMPDIDVNAMI